MELNDYRILAIDPSSTELGWAFLAGYELGSYGLISTKGCLYQNKFAYVIDALSGLVTLHRINYVACERAFKSQKRNTAALQVVVKSIEKWAEDKKLPLSLYSPGEWKRGIVGNGMATKEEVAAGIFRYFPFLDKTVSNHITDAIGIGLYFLDTKRLELMTDKEVKGEA